MKREKLEYLSYLIIVLIGAAFIGVLFLKHVIMAVMPFLFAWLVAFAARRPAAYISKRIRVPLRITRLAIAALVAVASIIAIVLFCRLVLGELWSLLSKIGEDDSFGESLSALSDQMLGIFGRLNLPEEIRRSIEEAFLGMVGSLLSLLGGILTGIASAIPRLLLFVIVTLIAVIYFALDLEGINASVRSILPERAAQFLVKLKNGAIGITGKYLRSYFLIMIITTLEMLAGFVILGVDYALLLAIIVAVLDLLPIIGVGTALIPAAVFCFISGNRTLAIGLIVLFAVNAVIRQIIEPKILGKHLGIHPLATLAAMYIGYSFFGFVGILLLPLVVMILGIYKNDPSEIAKSTDS